MPIKGSYLLLTGGGAILLWSGLKGKNWSTVIRGLINGKKPQTTTTAYTISAGNITGGINSQTGTPPPAISGSVLSQAVIGALWLSAGGSPATARNAVCHAIQESGGNSGITSNNPDGGINVGLWQLDTRGVGAGYSVSQLQNPYLNARLTVRATSGGYNWSQWSTPGC